MKTIALAAAVTLVAAASIGGLFYWLMASEHAYDPTDLLRIQETGKVYSFEVIDATNKPIWRVTSSEGAHLRRIDYGVVPPTFQQEVPTGPTRPRRLVSSEALSSTTVTETQVLRHEGRAAGAGAMSWGVSTFTPRPASPVQR